MGRAGKPGVTRKHPSPAASSITEYDDFVIVAKRDSARSVSVRVEASPAGRMAKAQKVPFPAEEADALRARFFSGFSGGGRGGLELDPDEATRMGKRLARVLFAGRVLPLFAESLAAVVRRPNRGMRIRLAMDEPLLDLPWEYVYRPDRLEGTGLSGFVLLDRSISMVRHAADPRIRVAPIEGRQRLAFVGTLWEGKRDGWGVLEEYSSLREALRPVASFIQPEFATATDTHAFEFAGSGCAAVLHYSGHCDFDSDGRAFMVREMPTSRPPGRRAIVYVDAIARSLAQGDTRLVVMSACNSGYWTAVKPLLEAGIPAVIGLNGGVLSQTAIEFCAKLYESLAVGLTLDEAVGRARMHVMKWGHKRDLFDWGLFMAHMPSPDATLFPRAATRAVTTRQESIRRDHAATTDSTVQLARELDGMNYSEILSQTAKRRVLILGRFTGRRLAILNGIKAHLEQHPGNYIAELFTYQKPEARDLVESIVGFAAFSRFIIADLSEPRSIPAELAAIVPTFQSVPVVPLINQTGTEYADFASLQRRPNVVKPTVRYRDLGDLIKKLDERVVPLAEKKLVEVRPPDRS